MLLSMATKTDTKKHYLVALLDDGWYAPTSATTPEEAVRFSDDCCEDSEALGKMYCVYELVSPNPVLLSPEIGLKRK